MYRQRVNILESEITTNEIAIADFGIYRKGLTINEIKMYLRTRARNTTFRKRSTEQLYKQFCKNEEEKSKVLETLENGKQVSLMYRQNVKQCADKLFFGKIELC